MPAGIASGTKGLHGGPDGHVRWSSRGALSPRTTARSLLGGEPPRDRRRRHDRAPAGTSIRHRRLPRRGRGRRHQRPRHARSRCIVLASADDYLAVLSPATPLSSTRPVNRIRLQQRWLRGAGATGRTRRRRSPRSTPASTSMCRPVRSSWSTLSLLLFDVLLFSTSPRGYLDLRRFRAPTPSTSQCLACGDGGAFHTTSTTCRDRSSVETVSGSGHQRP